MPVLSRFYMVISNLLRKKVTSVAIVVLCSWVTAVSVEASEAEEKLWQEKSQLVLKQLADNYKLPRRGDRGKYVMPALIAYRAMNPNTPLPGDLAQQLTSLTQKQGKDFYTNSDAFKAPGITRLLYLFPKDSQLQAAQQDYFAYLFPTQEAKAKYNFWRSGGTENFVNMLRTSGYLLAQKAVTLDLPQAEQKLANKERWLTNKAQKTYQKGTAEWDSSSYTIFNLVGWLNVYDFAEDPEMKAKAKAVLDYYAAAMALKYSDGIYGGAEQRGGSATIPYNSHTDFLGWFWFSEDIPEDLNLKWPQYIQLVHPATSSYRPPNAAIALARKRNLEPSFYHNAKANYSLSKLIVPEMFYIASTYTLGTALVTNGEQVVNWKLVSLGKESAPAKTVTGANSYSHKQAKRNGMGKTIFDRFFQYENVLFQATYVPKEAKSQLGKQQLRNLLVDTIAKIPCGNSCRFWLTSRVNKQIPPITYPVKKVNGSYQVANYLSFPVGTQLIKQQDKYFVQLNDTYLAISPFPSQDLKLETQDNRSYLEVTAPLETMTGFVIEVGSQQHENFDNFQQQYNNKKPLNLKQLEWEKVRYQTIEKEQLLFDFGKNYNQSSLRINSKAMDLPLTHLYDGKHLQLKNRVLQLTTPKYSYEVDFQSNVPVFDEKLR